MNDEHNTLTEERPDLEPLLEGLQALPDVASVHVRTVLPQCFLYAATASREPSCAAASPGHASGRFRS